ncbi:MAG: LPS export ABC transporter permease LptF [Bradyrhizobiaceae bacterium]|nr:MAG: LPS export ABC transporter permease LptF [Bradyrhizobiaceae bacterium]
MLKLPKLSQWLGAIDAYIVRLVMMSFAIVLISLTGVIWITQALRGIDLMTSQGQTILVFIGITGLAIPLLALIIAPIALVIAVTHTLNKLATDSETIVLSAAGMSPERLIRPFMVATVIVSVFVASLSIYIAPECLRALRRWNSEIGADVVANVLQPGQFIKLGKLTLRVRERQPGGVLAGVFIDDQRSPSERINVIAESGAIQKNQRGSFLVLRDGNLQRFENDKKEPAMVGFKSYAFDMSQFSSAPTVTYNSRERFISELISPPPEDNLPPSEIATYWGELHDRLMAPIYPFVFAIMAFAFLGLPRTTRQGRNYAISMLLLAVMTVRIAGFICSTLAPAHPEAIYVQYVMLVVVSGLSVWMIRRGIVVDPPSGMLRFFASLRARMPSFARA